MLVSIAITSTATHTLASGAPDRVSLLAVRDAIYEQAERRFIGFAQSIQTFPGGTDADTIQIVTDYHPGHGPDRVLRRQVLSAQTQDGTGNVFKSIVNHVVALDVTGLSGDPRLKRAAITETDVTTSEPGETPALVRARFAYDGEARQIEEDRDGGVVDGVPLAGDQTVIKKTYTAEDATTEVRDVVCEQITLDGSGHEVSHLRRLFGDATSEARSASRATAGCARSRATSPARPAG